MTPKVSVVLPVYNVEKYLERCINSIVEQTYTDIEIILVDDGSPDNSPEICDQYAQRDSRVKVLHKPNGGLSDARNAGLEIALGEFIMFIDSDDYVEPHMIESLINIIRNEESDVVIFGFFADFVDCYEKLLSTRITCPVNGHYIYSTFKDIPIDGDMVGLFGYAWNKLYTVDVIKSNNMKFTKNISLVEDILFNGPLLMKCEKITFVHEPFVHYMQRPRMTLGNKFYDNYFNLKLMAIGSVEKLLLHWNKSYEQVMEIRQKSEFNALKSTVRLLSNATNYNNTEKLEYLDAFFHNMSVQEQIKAIKVDSIKDIVIKFLLVRKKYKVLIKLYQKSLLRRWFE